MTQASQRYKIPPAMLIHEVTGLNDMLAISELDSRFLHNQCSHPEPDCGRLLGLMPATRRYKVHLCRIGTHESANPSESGLSAGL